MTGLRAPARIPESHRDLVERPICGVLTTIAPDGQPHAALVWVDADGDTIRINTTLERATGRNLLANRAASVLIVDPGDTSRFLQVRGDIDVVRDGAIEHLDGLTRAYTGHPHFYGFVYPAERAASETRVIARLSPARVSVDAIHR